jgi:glutaredoxin
VKEFLSQKNVPFSDKNIREDPRALEELRGLGFTSIPVTVIGDQRIVGFDPAKIAAALAL